MLNTKKLFIRFIMLLLASILLAGCGRDSVSSSNEPFVFPGGGFCTYKYYNRSLTLNDFVNIKIGMTYSEIKDILGEPNGVFGSGLQWPFYETSDKIYIMLYVGLEPDSELFDIRIVDASGRAFELEKEIVSQKQGTFEGLVPEYFDLNDLVGTYDNFILDEKLALEIGSAVLNKVYGEEKLIDTKFIVSEIDGKDYFIVSLLPISDSDDAKSGETDIGEIEIYLGGDYNVAISKKDGKILRIWMGE